MLDLRDSPWGARIQENLIAYMRLFAGVDGMLVHDEQGPDCECFWLVCLKPGPGHSVLRMRWPAHNVETRIDALFGQVGQYVDAIDWQVYPGDEPADLGLRLAARGMPPQRGGNWMYIDLDQRAAPPVVPAGFRVELVRDDAMMAEWLRLSLAGFAGQEVLSFAESHAALGSFYDAYARHGYGPQAYSLHYIGYVGDQPVTSGTVLDAGGTAAIYDLSTPPSQRRRGFGGALTWALMDVIRARGYRETWIWGSNMARDLYASLGYADADFGIREHCWRKPG